MPKIWNKYSQKRNIGAPVLISTFMCLWANYIFPRWVCLICWRKYVDRSWEYINRSQTHEFVNWDWGRAIPRKGIHKWDFRCSAQTYITSTFLCTSRHISMTVFRPENERMPPPPDRWEIKPNYTTFTSIAAHSTDVLSPPINVVGTVLLSSK